MAHASSAQPTMKRDDAQGDRAAGIRVARGEAPAPAQCSSGTFSTVTAVSHGNVNAPQMRILQTKSNDCARYL
jgi:hypothetical protein